MADRPGILGTPLGQFGLGALALVVGGALLFSLIGAVSDDGDPAAAPADPTTAATTTDDGGTDGATDAPSTPASEDPGTDAPPTDTPTEDGTTAEPTATETSDAPPAIDPATITIQVLSGSDSSDDHDAVVACLEAAGYDDLITSNRARTTYANTTVFYTAGSEAEGRQVADALGIAQVEEQPGNLSESVPVHVVSGQDGASGC